jgi:hypothetical protein
MLPRRDKDLRLAMYEELLPYWKERCLTIRDLKEPGRLLHNKWTDMLKKKRLKWEWVSESGHNDGYYHNCIVQGIILFTWEAGLEP